MNKHCDVTHGGAEGRRCVKRIFHGEYRLWILCMIVELVLLVQMHKDKLRLWVESLDDFLPEIGSNEKLGPR